MRYSDSELSLIKGTFSENDELLIALRKVFLQIPLSPLDQSLLITIKGHTEILDILKKTFLPEIDGDAPFNQVIDLWMTVEIKNKSTSDAKLEVLAREKLIHYIKQQLDFISSGKDGKIRFDSLVDTKLPADDLFVNMAMRNTLIHHVEMQLLMLSMLAGQKTETVEQTKERLRKDSTK